MLQANLQFITLYLSMAPSMLASFKDLRYMRFDPNTYDMKLNIIPDIQK